MSDELDRELVDAIEWEEALKGEPGASMHLDVLTQARDRIRELEEELGDALKAADDNATLVDRAEAERDELGEALETAMSSYTLATKHSIAVTEERDAMKDVVDAARDVLEVLDRNSAIENDNLWAVNLRKALDALEKPDDG